MPKKMSPEQLTANQRNAAKSTGPTTPEGRTVSKMNALKHGILSREVVVSGRKINESSRQFKALHRRFADELNPVGPMEEMLVDQIVTTHWRLRRVLTAESAEIALSVDEGEWKRFRGPAPILLWMRWESGFDMLYNMRESSLGCGLIEGWLNEIRKSVEQEGELTEAAVKTFGQLLRGKPNTITKGMEAILRKTAQNPDALDAAVLKERNKTQAMALLNRELSTLAWWKSQCKEREDCGEQARQAAAVLPAPDVLDKILRYQTTLERQLFRAMAHLERLQRMRRGEAVAAPVAVEVSERI